VRVVFFGTPHFAREILDDLLKHHVEVVAVVTKEDKPLGRSQKKIPPAVKVLAEERGIAVYQPQKASSEEFVSFLKTLKSDLFIVAAFSEILKSNLLGVPRLGCINVHASLLPKYRGAAPIARAIWEGEKESGVSIMKIDEGLDTGGVLAMEKIPIPPDMTAGELSEKMVEVGAKKLFEVLQNFSSYSPVAQKDDASCYAKKITAEDCEVHWDKPSSQVYRQIRALLPKPGPWCRVKVRGEEKRLKILKARECSSSGVAGQIVKKPLTIACKEGSIELLEVQLEGKKPMKSDEFIRGVDNIVF